MPEASGAAQQRTSGSPAKSELGVALRAWRERVTPAQAGLPAGGDRRVPGLRREELALLVGISVDYLVRLEQGRATAPSAQVLRAFARALRLETRKTVVHPGLGPIMLDCDVLTIDGHDLRIVLYSAAPGTRDADLLDEVRALSARTADRGSAPPPLPSRA